MSKVIKSSLICVTINLIFHLNSRFVLDQTRIGKSPAKKKHNFDPQVVAPFIVRDKRQEKSYEC